MRLFMACSGMMLGAYEHLRSRFLTPGNTFNELRSYVELEYFTGHTLPRYGSCFFLDSGAFSAYSRGAPVTVDAYGEFLGRYSGQIEYYANLDAIPDGSVQRAAEDTRSNQRAFEAKGLSPIPVFHKGEPFSFLEEYIEQYPYLCLGGLVSDSDIDNEQFFNHVWKHFLTNPDGTPKLKVHAFGMTSLKLLKQYPWYSADSSTWLIHSKLGQIAVPTMKPDGSYDYNTKPWLLFTSEKSRAKEWYGYHIDSLDPTRLALVQQYLDSKQIKLDDLRGYPDWRFAANLEYWLDLQKFGSFPSRYVQAQVELL